MSVPCCAHSVERHAYNGCANCWCSVRWDQHPDRERDTSPEGRAANRARREHEEFENDVDCYSWPHMRQGGQHVGVNTGVLAVHRRTGIAAINEDERSQHRNRQAALAKLRILVDAWNKLHAARVEVP